MKRFLLLIIICIPVFFCSCSNIEKTDIINFTELGSAYKFDNSKFEVITDAVFFESVHVLENGFFSVKIKDKEFLLNEQFCFVDSYPYDKIQVIDDNLFKVKANGLYGIIDDNGKDILDGKTYNKILIGDEILSYNFDSSKKKSIPPFIMAKKSKKWCLFDLQGILIRDGIYKPTYGDYWDAKNRLMIFSMNSEYEWGAIDETGREVIPFKYSYLNNFDNYIYVELDDKMGLLDKSGREIIPIEYNNISKLEENIFSLNYRGKYGLLNLETGKSTKFKYNDIYEPSKLGACAGACIGEKRVYLDYNFDESFPQLDNTFMLSEYLIQIENKNGKYAIMDNNYNLLSDYLYDYLNTRYGGYNDSFFDFMIDNNTGVINKYGKVILEAGEVDSFRIFDKYLSVNKGNSYDLVDVDGNNVLSNIDYEIEEFTKENKLFIAIKNKKYGVVDIDGKEIVPFIYSMIGTTKSKLFKATLNKEIVLFDYNGDAIGTYEDFNDLSDENMYKVKKNNKVGILNLDGEEILKPIYSDIKYINKRFYVTIGTKKGVLDIKGNEIIPCDFDSISDIYKRKCAVQKDNRWIVLKIME